MNKRHRPKKVRITYDFNAGAERMMATLTEIKSVIRAAKRDVRKEKAAGRSGWRKLSVAIAKIRLMVRPKPGTFAWDSAVGYFLEHEPHLRWVADIPPIVPGDGKGLSAVEFINGRSDRPQKTSAASASLR